MLGLILAAVYTGRQRIVWKVILAATAALLILTVVFDNLIIASGIVAYDVSRISGLYIGKAPIEDFAYAIGASLLVPYIWEKMKDKI
jgi:lycopene cyclase domain-containing protein